MAIKKPIVKRPAKTLKEKKFVAELIKNGGNKVQAALVAYDVNSYNAASTIAAENVHKLTLDDYFVKAGYTDEIIAQNIARIGLTAKRIVGTSNDFIEVEDSPTQLKAAELAIKIMGKFAPQRAPVDAEGKTVTPIYALGAE